MFSPHLSRHIVLDSLSSSLMFGVTIYRNRHGKLFCEAAYGLITIVATIESIAALIMCGLSCIVYPTHPSILDSSLTSLKSSSFTIGWSAIAFYLNSRVSTLVADEPSARQIYNSHSYYWMPPTAIS